MQKKPGSGGYWEARRELLYYQVVRQLVAELGSDATSLIDVGSGDCPYLDWFDHVPTRISVDPERPYGSRGVTAVKADFLDWEPSRGYDLATCLQVLEHVPRPDLFARKLLAVAKTVVVSVPYDWPPGGDAGHLHDPITEGDMRAWFGREPNFSFVCREVQTHSERLIQVYEQSPIIWSNLSKRRQILSKGGARGSRLPSRLAWIDRRVRKNVLFRSLRRQWFRLRRMQVRKGAKQP
jgi:hypothetical protein